MAIKQHQERQTAARQASGLPWEDNDLVFPNPFGQMQDPRSWSKKFKRIAKAAGINITFHKLRHDHASRLSENGVSIKDAQYRLGHSTTQMLLTVYTHRISGGQEKIATWLNTSFPAAPTDHETPLQ
ncbi:Tyrosine recombinase XerD [Sporomusa carbonis]